MGRFQKDHLRGSRFLLGQSERRHARWSRLHWNRDLIGADLSAADLTGAKITGADLTGAIRNKLTKGPNAEQVWVITR
jgi:uncharacterized protein YjbI with pentapeptide repeats